MPRPVLGPGGHAGYRDGSTFDELIQLLQQEHNRLYCFAGGLERENAALRRRLQICGEIADGSEDMRVAEVMCSPGRGSNVHCMADAQSLTPSSLWRRHLGPAGWCSATPGGGAVPPVTATLASPVHNNNKATVQELLEGIPSENSVDIDRCIQRQDSAGCSSGSMGDGNVAVTSSGNVVDAQVYGEERRLNACMSKLRDMFDLNDTRQILALDHIEGYFKRVGLDTEANMAALNEIMSRLVAYEKTQNISTSSVSARQLYANAASGSRLTQKLDGSKLGRKAKSGFTMSVQMSTFAALLLAEDIAFFLGATSEDINSCVSVIRTHTFHQDVMGVLPSAAAAGAIEKDVKESKWDYRFDLFMNAVIAVNAICMGFFAGQKSDEWGTPQILDLVFTIIFMMELLIKLRRTGFKGYFCGKDWSWNWFDSIIVALGLSDFIMTLAVVSSGSFNASTFMALRLLRLGRLLRVVRMSLFRELKLMINGIVGLLKTLSCALIILLVAIYFWGTVMVQLFGVQEPGTQQVLPHQDMLFSSVPRSMFTVFRCLNLGDCNDIDGTPIALHLSESVGWPFTIMHCILSVLMNYGLGSLITALVVDTTLNEAKKAEFRNTLKDSHKKHMSWSLHRLEQIFEEAQKEEEGCLGKPGVPSMLFISRKGFQAVLKRQDVQRILDEMDIDSADRTDLFDALDADGNGRIEIDELVGGLIRMSGKARRADTVATRLKMDALVKRLAVTTTQLLDDNRMILERLDHVGGQPASPTTSSPAHALRAGSGLPFVSEGKKSNS